MLWCYSVGLCYSVLVSAFVMVLLLYYSNYCVMVLACMIVIAFVVMLSHVMVLICVIASNPVMVLT